MKLFTQLALVTAIASCGSAYAMQSMDDAALSGTTGQDGITILIAPPTLTLAQQASASYGSGSTAETTNAITQTNGLIIGAAVLHDKDGIAANVNGGTNPAALGGGAIIIGDANQANTNNAVGVQMGIFGSTPISVVIDASNGQATHGTGGTTPVLNVSIGLPADLMIRTGDISVDGSARAALTTGATDATVANQATGGTDGNAVQILKSMDISMGGATMNIQLGNTPQGAMILAGGTITGGLSIDNLSVHDANTGLGTFGGDLGVSRLTVTDHGSTDLSLGAKIDIVSDVTGALTGTASATPVGGLIIESTSTAGTDIMMQNVTLGNSASTLGDLQLINVQTAGTRIVVQGH